MKIGQALQGVVSLYLDTAPIIYFIENHVTYANIVDSVLSVSEISNIALTTNVITLTEVLNKPIREKDAHTEANYREMIVESGAITLVEISKAVAEQAAHLRAKYNFRTPDALHIASAIDVGCDAFLTNDFGLRRVQELRVLVIDELEIEA